MGVRAAAAVEPLRRCRHVRAAPWAAAADTCDDNGEAAAEREDEGSTEREGEGSTRRTGRREDAGSPCPDSTGSVRSSRRREAREALEAAQPGAPSRPGAAAAQEGRQRRLLRQNAWCPPW